MKKFIFPLLFLVFSHSYGQEIKKITSVEGITEYQLTNGLKVLLFPDPSVETQTVNITYLVGSRHEGYGESGMAHLLEHMVFKGTPNHPNIPEELSNHGARPNGTTWYDRTNYYETFSASDENLDWALDLEADRMVNSYIAKKDLESEFSVVRNEFESGENNPGRVLMQNTLSAAYKWHNYGKSTIGSREDIEKVPIENLKAFYKKYYRPDNAILVVAGKIDEDKTLKLVQKKFGGIKNPSTPLPKTYTVEPAQDGEKFVSVERVGETSALAMVYHVPSASHPEHIAASLAGEILTDNPSGRLYKEFVESNKASYIYNFTPTLHDDGFSFFGMQPNKDQNPDNLRAELAGLLDNLKENPITQKELENAKIRSAKSYEKRLQETSRLGVNLSEYIAAGDWRLLFLTRDRIEKVTLEEVNAAISKYLIPTNRTVGIFYPQKEVNRVKMPERPNVKTLVADYKGKKALKQGEAFEASYANIKSRTDIGKLTNGIPYALLTKETKGEKLILNLTLRFGDEKTASNWGLTPSLVGELLSKGTTNRTKEEIDNQLAKLKSDVRIYATNQKLGINISTIKSSLEPTLDIVMDMVKNPLFDEKELEKIVSSNKTNIETQITDPFALAQDKLTELTRKYPEGHPLYGYTMKEELQQYDVVSIKDIKNFYDKMVGSTAGTIVGIGDFDKAKVIDRLNKELVNWKKGKPYTRIQEKALDLKPSYTQIETPDKEMSMIIGITKFEMDQNSADYPGMILAESILGGGFLNSRLANRLRQQDGISYGVGSFLNVPYDVKDGGIGYYAIYAPQNLEKAKTGVKEEIQRIIDEGFTAKELEDVRKGWKQNVKVALAKDNELTSRLNNNLFYNRDMMWFQQLEDAIDKITLEQVNAIFKKYVKADNFIQIVAGDFANKG